MQETASRLPLLLDWKYTFVCVCLHLVSHTLLHILYLDLYVGERLQRKHKDLPLEMVKALEIQVVLPSQSGREYKGCQHALWKHPFPSELVERTQWSYSIVRFQNQKVLIVQIYGSSMLRSTGGLFVWLLLCDFAWEVVSALLSSSSADKVKKLSCCLDSCSVCPEIFLSRSSVA